MIEVFLQTRSAVHVTKTKTYRDRSKDFSLFQRGILFMVTIEPAYVLVLNEKLFSPRISPRSSIIESS